MSETIKKDPTGAVMVVGGGIAGIQASLDLADSGYLVYLVERKSSIGGRMSQLDKTFPTNDCAMCMVSPKLIGVAGHPNIRILTLSELVSVTGTPGYFSAKVKKHPRYVDESRCVGCGLCAEKCPSKVADPYNQGLTKRRAIHLRYPQAVPLVYSIDAEHCLHLTKGKCGNCEKVCKQNAINFDQKEEVVDIPVGSVILAPGFDLFEAEKAGEYGYGRYENVITTMEFERCLSATGPTDGHITRPSDKTVPKKIAWIQCVGSRERLREGRAFCSSVCCMASAKEAVVAKSHHPEIEPTIFYMDLRAQGKGFDAYCERARETNGVKYVRSMISRVAQNPVTKDLILTHLDPATGKPVDESFNMVVLAVGMKPSAESAELASRLGIEVNEFGFAKTKPEAPLVTSKEGVYVCGAFAGPKDIPETVAEASGAAVRAMEPIAGVKGYEISTPAKPAERSLFGKKTRVGVVVCCCGTNIAGVVDVEAAAAYARTLPEVEAAEVMLFACSTDSKAAIKDMIVKNQLNRMVVASCSPKTHEELFRSTLVEAGLNPYLIEMANIRNQCSWVHAKDGAAATEKSKELIRMSVGRVKQLTPIEAKSVPVVHTALVVGGGLSGMTAALTLAGQGYVTHLVEKDEALGGRYKNSEPLADWDQARHVEDLISRVNAHQKVRVHTGSVVEKSTGQVGNFVSRIKTADGAEVIVKHGAGVIATGAVEAATTEYLFGKSDRVLTQTALSGRIKAGRASKGKGLTVMIQCVGSRNAERPYCSRTCCTQAVVNAIRLKEENPAGDVIVLYRDIRTFGFMELLYEKARKLGVVFIRHEAENPPEAFMEGGALKVRFTEPALGRKMTVAPDQLVLSTGLDPNPASKQISSVFKLPVDPQGFFLEAHPKLRPLDFTSDGLFLCGDAHGPKFPEESIAQALGAAGRAVTILSRDAITVGPVSEVDPELCAACLTCVRTCPYSIPAINEKGVSYIDPARCKGCGMCAAECPVGAISVQNCSTGQIEAKMTALFSSP